MNVIRNARSYTFSKSLTGFSIIFKTKVILALNLNEQFYYDTDIDVDRNTNFCGHAVAYRENFGSVIRIPAYSTIYLPTHT